MWIININGLIYKSICFVTTWATPPKVSSIDWSNGKPIFTKQSGKPWKKPATVSCVKYYSGDRFITFDLTKGHLTRYFSQENFTCSVGGFMNHHLSFEVKLFVDFSLYVNATFCCVSPPKKKLAPHGCNVS